MIKSGDKIVMTKALPGFDKVGKKFELTAIDDDGTITFKSPFGIGIMTPKEYGEHFKLAPIEYVWSQWSEDWDDRFGSFQYKTNNKKVKVKWGGEKGEATCHPSDVFSLLDGQYIALARCYMKYVMKEHGHAGT